MMGSGVQVTQAAPFVKIQNDFQAPPICPRLDSQIVNKKTAKTASQQTVKMRILSAGAVSMKSFLISPW